MNRNRGGVPGQRYHTFGLVVQDEAPNEMIYRTSEGRSEWSLGQTIP